MFGLGVVGGLVGFWVLGCCGCCCEEGCGLWDEVVGDGWGLVVASLLLDHVDVVCSVGMGVGALVCGVPEVEELGGWVWIGWDDGGGFWSMVEEGPFIWVEVFDASGVESVVICSWGWAFGGV